MNRPHNLCRGCGNPCDPGFNWHDTCRKTYRGSVPYRELTLARDGHNCAKCFDWHNRAINSWHSWKWEHTPAWLRHRVSQHRRVQVDHVEPLAGQGTHDPTNLQVLCERHHAKKTKRDLARLQHRHVPAKFPPWVIPTALATVFAVYLFAPGTWQRSQPGLAGAAVALTVFAVRFRFRSTFKAGLRTGLAAITGDVDTKRRTLSARRWRFRKVDPLRLPRLRPTQITIRYPHTFKDDDVDKQAQIEAKIEAKCGQDSWYAQWFTGANQVKLISPDPLVGMASIPWPNAAAAQLSLWEPIPVGLGVDGRVVTTTIVERNLLIGGEPGGGKSVAQSIFTATAALDPDVVLYGIDGKQKVELRPWEPCMEALVGSGKDAMTDAMGLLEHIRQVMDDRYELLNDLGIRKISRDTGLPLHVLVIDELAVFTSSTTKTASEKFSGVLRDIIQRGRAAGVIVVAATQRPSADVVPTAVRDLMGVRWAMRCTTPQSSDMVLGQGWASRGFSAARIPSVHRGIGFLLAEGGEPVRLRSFHLDDGALAAVAGRAAALRSRPVGTGEGSEQDPRPTAGVLTPTQPASV